VKKDNAENSRFLRNGCSELISPHSHQVSVPLLLALQQSARIVASIGFARRAFGLGLHWFIGRQMCSL